MQDAYKLAVDECKGVRNSAATGKGKGKGDHERPQQQQQQWTQGYGKRAKCGYCGKACL